MPKPTSSPPSPPPTQSSEKETQNMGSWFSKKDKSQTKTAKEPKIDPFLAEMVKYTIEAKRVSFSNSGRIWLIPNRWAHWGSSQEEEEFEEIEEEEIEIEEEPEKDTNYGKHD